MPDDRLSMAEQLSAGWDKLEAREEPTDAREASDPARQGQDGQGAEAGAESAEAQRARDEAGRFAKADNGDGKAQPREKLTLKPKESKDAAKEPERGAETQPQAAKDVAGERAGGQPAGDDVRAVQAPIQPPAHWLGAAKKHWDRLPPEVRESIASDAQHVAATQGVGKVIEPYAQRFQQEFGGPDRALGVILDAWKFARQSPIDFVKQFAQHNNIDLSTLSGGVQQQQADPGQAADPALAPVIQRMQQFEAALQQIQQQPVIAQQNHIASEIEAFRSNAAHPYFNDVRPHMGVLMAAGQPDSPKTLQEAYDMACWANPRIRAEMMKDEATKQAEQRKAAVGKAQRAGGSITGSPGVARAETHVNQSARADLAKNWDMLEARV